MKKARFQIVEGRVVLIFADGKQAILPPSFSKPTNPNGNCEYLRKKKRLYITLEGQNMVEVKETDVEFKDPPKVAERKQQEEEEQRQRAAIKAAQDAAIQGAESNLQPSLENGKVDFWAEKIAALDKSMLKTYTDAAKGAWALVRRHTIGPAVQFFDYQKTKNNDLGPAYAHLNEHLISWFMDKRCMLSMRPMDRNTFLSFLTEEVPSQLYRAYTMETLSCLQWAARLAEAESKND